MKVTAEKSPFTMELMEANKDPLVVLDANGVILDVNASMISIMGISRAELEGADFYKYISEKQRGVEVIKALANDGLVIDFPLKVRTQKGELVPVLLNGTVHGGCRSEAAGVIITMRPVEGQQLASQYARSLIDASFDPLFAVGQDGKITDMNEASILATGVSRESMMGSNFVSYFTEPDKAGEICKKIFAIGFVHDSPLTLKNLEKSDLLFNGSVYKDEQGMVLGIVVEGRDITDQKRFATELTEAIIFAELATAIAEEAKLKAEKATKTAVDAVNSKQQFLSNMSHEIRTPLNAIIGFTNVMLKTALSAKQKECLTAIQMSGDTLILLINDILDLAKVDAGKMTFEKIPFKMSTSISAMLYLLEAKILEKNLILKQSFDKRIPEVLVGDPVRLHQIILNLLSNAVKFTSTGSITVNVRLLSEDEDQVEIEFSVIDTGIGIPEDKIAEIFANFQQASSETGRLYGGTGLGLAISKQLVESQGGGIWVESKIDEGSTFSFNLKFKKTKLGVKSDSRKVELDPGIRGIRVLVVEDIALNQLLMKTLLNDFGFEKDIVNNGQEAIEILRRKDYDIVLMDLQMPIMNGFETARYIRDKMNSKIPIIALTADVTTVDLAKCTAAGMDDYITKPVDERLLYSKILSHVKKGAANHLKEKVSVSSLSNGIKYTDLKYLGLRTKSNPELMAEMISLFLEQTPVLVSSMRRCWEGRDWNTLLTTVHKMIPSFSIMGMSGECETMAKQIMAFAISQMEGKGAGEAILQLENLCNQACRELGDHLEKLKSTVK